MGRAKEIIYLSIIFIFAIIILFWNIGTGSLTSWDEALYAQVSKEMLISNNWLDLTWAGQPWSDKPPLYMWFTVIFYKLFGINELSVRLFSALCGLGTVVITYFLARRLYSKEAGFVSSLILLSTYQFLLAAKMGMLDCAFTFFITLALFLFKLGEERKGYLFWFWLAFCAAFMVKGAGALIILIILAVYLISSRQLWLFKQKQFLFGMLLAFAILFYWHFQSFMHYGQGFIRGYFIKHLLIRTTTTVEGHTGDLFTYFGVLGNKGRPWGIFGIIAIFFIFYRIIIKRENKHLLPFTWAIGVFIVFSLVKTKLHWYIVPIYPALAVLISYAFVNLFRKKAVIVILVLFIIFSGYLAIAKKIYFLDLSPNPKRVALAVNKITLSQNNLFFYGVGDPGIIFYLDSRYKYLSEEQLKAKLKEKDNYIVFETNILRKSVVGNFDLILEDSGVSLVKIR